MKNMLSLEAFADWCRGQKGVFSPYDETGNAAARYYKTLGMGFERDNYVDTWDEFDKRWPIAKKLTWLMARAGWENCGGLTPYGRLANFVEQYV